MHRVLQFLVHRSANRRALGETYKIIVCVCVCVSIKEGGGLREIRTFLKLSASKKLRKIEKTEKIRGKQDTSPMKF